MSGEEKTEDPKAPKVPTVLTEEQKQQRRDLFAAYGEAAKKKAAAEEALAKADEAQSAVVSQIRTKFGSGPFRYGGELLRISKRGSRAHFIRLKEAAEEI